MMLGIIGNYDEIYFLAIQQFAMENSPCADDLPLISWRFSSQTVHSPGATTSQEGEGKDSAAVQGSCEVHEGP